MSRLYVTASARGMGLGKAFIRELIVLAKEAGYHETWLGVFKDNHAAVHMYEGMGFQRRKPYKDRGYSGMQDYYLIM